MTTNEILTKQNFLTKLVLKSGNSELSKDLKIKVMKLRIELAKIRRSYDEDVQEFTKELIPDRFKELQEIEEDKRTAEEKKEFEELVTKINSDYAAYLKSRGNDPVDVDPKFTEEEFEEIVNVNADNNTEVNGVKLTSADYLEAIYMLFVQ